MIEVRKTAHFDKWLSRLRDAHARARVNVRIRRIETGNLGDHKMFAKIGEFRIDAGPGYRLYFARRGEVIIILLCGGDKDSQDQDIKLAQELEKEIA